MDTIVPMPATIRQVAQFITLLEQNGIAQAEIQRCIDEPAFRREIVRVMRGFQQPLVDISGGFNDEAEGELLHYLFESAPVASLQYLRRCLDYDPLEHFLMCDVIKVLLDGLSPLHVAVVVLRRGLLDGKEMLAKNVGEQLGLSSTQVSKFSREATWHMKHALWEYYPLPDLEQFGPQPSGRLKFGMLIDYMPLSERARIVLKREGVRTVAQLVSKSRDELRTMRAMGSRAVAEIDSELATSGLSLKSTSS